MRRSLVFALVLLPASVSAQQGAKTVAPGMTKSQVTNVLGEPATMRTASDYTYLFYLNTCGKRCGMNDLVVLHGDSVVDAIFRSPLRHYSGVSSSPAQIPPHSAARMKPAASSAPMKMPSGPAEKPAKPTVLPTPTPRTVAKPTQMKPGPANDTRPSIPINPPVVKPAPTKPASRTP